MTPSLLDLEELEPRLARIVDTSGWRELQTVFNAAGAIFIVGNGGNLAVADHAAVDIQRLTGKVAAAPSSGVVATSLINEKGADRWIAAWLDSVSAPYLRSAPPQRVLAIGLSCSIDGTSSDAISEALDACEATGGRAFLLAAREKRGLSPRVTQILTSTVTYHATEILALALMYQLVAGSGAAMEQLHQRSQGEIGSG